MCNLIVKMLRVICVRFSSGLPKRIRPTKEQLITEYGDYRDFTNMSTNSDFDRVREPGFLTRPRFVGHFILFFLRNSFKSYSRIGIESNFIEERYSIAR